MSVMFYYVGIIFLLISILYTGRQINIYLRMKRKIGKRLSPLTPGRDGLRRLLLFGIAFLILFVIVTGQYISLGYELSVSYSIVLSVVIFSCGRFLTKMSELREDGLMGNLEAVPYGMIKSHKVEENASKILIRFLLKDGREFVAVVAEKDKEEVLDILKKKL